jgi:DNA-binding FadR family transcriptional regulator
MIESGQLAPGAQLPSERDLSEQIGVSRNVLREAFRVLEHRGFIQVRAGAGRYVRPVGDREHALSGDATVGALEKASLADAIEARLVVEPEVVRQAAQRCTKADARILLKLAKGRHGWEANRAFHVGIAEVCGNFALQHVVGQLLDLSREIRQRQHYGESSLADTLLSEHNAIAKAIIAGDANVAAKLMHSHLKATHLSIKK